MFTQWIRWFAVTLGLLGSTAAWAASYSLPAALGSAPFASCSLASGSTYNCTAANITLSANDSVTLSAPVTLNLTTGNFVAGNNVTVNSSGYDFKIVAAKNVTLGSSFNGAVSLQATLAVSVNAAGVSSVLTGDITAGTTLTLGANTTVAGTCAPSNAACIGRFSIDKVASATTVPANTNFTFTLTARNTTGAAQAGVVITDDLNAAGLLFVSCTTAIGSCSNTSGVVTWSAGSIASGASRTATLTVRSATAGGFTNKATSNVGTPAVYAQALVQIYSPLVDWHMDELSWNGTAGEVKDSSGNGYNGRARRAAGSTPLPTTAAALPAVTSGGQTTCGYGQFDTTTGTIRTYGYVELSGIPALPTSFTFAAWIRSTQPSQSGQRILVRDDAQNGWGFSLGDPGQAKIRFFNRNITNSGTVTGTGSNPSCGVFCIDTSAVISANAWFFVAVSIDTTGKTITLYVFDAAGNLKDTTSSAFTGTWKDGTGLASIGGETSASSEGTTSAFHFNGNIDELQIYNGVLAQADLALLLTRTRSSCATTLDHVELVHNGSGLNCTPQAITVLGCTTSASCNGVPANQISGNFTFTPTAITGAQWCTDATCIFPITGSVTTSSNTPIYLREPNLRTDVMAGTASGANTTAVQCTNTTTATYGTSAAACGVTYVGSGFLVSVPNHLSCTPQTITLQAVKSGASGTTCTPAFSDVNRNVQLYSGYTNPSSGTQKASLDYVTSLGGATTAVAALATSPGSPTTLSNLYFDSTGTATISGFRYPDVGQVTLYPTYTGSAATFDATLALSAVSGNVFIAAPASFAFSGIPAAPLTAGNAFNVTLTAKNACATPTTTPNFGKEATPATVNLASNNPQPGPGNATAINQTVAGFGTPTSGQASTNVTWKEVGTVDLVATTANYLSSGLSPASTQAATGRFKPAYFDTTLTTPGCGTFTYSEQPMATVKVTARATGNTVTANYGGPTWARLVTLSDGNGGTGTWANNTIAATSFASGIGTTSTASYKFASKATAPYALKLRAAEPAGADGVDSSTGAEATGTIVSGRASLSNAYGSEMLALPLMTKVEYYDATPFAGWRQATSSYVDTCTSIAATHFAFTTAPACTATVPSCITGVSVNGSVSAIAPSPWVVSLLKPTAAGSVCITLNLDGTAPGARCTAVGAAGSAAASAAAPWLKYGWTSATDSNPTARATFGIYKSPVIYRRENY